jgi:uncharacterized SAM-binding protein YcdF (DUF218 family)
LGIKGLGYRIGFFITALKIFTAAFTAVTLAVIFTPAANMLARTLVVPEDLRSAEIIVVLGGGAYENGSLGGASNERLLYAVTLFRDGYAPYLLFTGGSIVDTKEKIVHTVLKRSGAESIDVSEAQVMYSMALKTGIPAGALALDATSTNTFENLVHAKGYMDEKGLGKCLLVTSPTHMRRAALIAEKLKMDCRPAPVPDYTPYRRGAVDRLSLFMEVLWEYAGLVLYRVYGYI